jgi:hypothetical protein
MLISWRPGDQEINGVRNDALIALLGPGPDRQAARTSRARGAKMSRVLQEQELSAVEMNDRLEAMRKIVSSNSFAKASRLSSFLTYIVEKSIYGDTDSLTEQQVGIHVFHRAPGYNSNDDNIVRGTARSLRQRLANYYLTEGAEDAIRIEIPKGAYVALFTDSMDIRESEVPDRPDERQSIQDYVKALPEKIPGIRRGIWALPILACAVLAIVLWPTIHARLVRSQDKSSLLWNAVFTRDRNAFIVAGDAGLNMYEWMEKRSVDLNSYSHQRFEPDKNAGQSLADDLGARFYATVPDMQLVTKLVRLPEANSERVQVRFARDLTVRDLKDANLILMGTSSYNPWTELFQSSLTLQMSWDAKEDLFTVINRAPLPGEMLTYHWTVKNGTQGGLTLISLTDNTQGSGRVLLIEGTTMGGIYAGTDFLFNNEMLNPILARAQRPDGTLRNFDLLIQSDFINEGASNVHLLATHIR